MTGGVRSEILRVLGEELAARVREGTPKAAFASLRADVQDGLVPGATLADVTEVAMAGDLRPKPRGKYRA